MFAQHPRSGVLCALVVHTVQMLGPPLGQLPDNQHLPFDQRDSSCPEWELSGTGFTLPSKKSSPHPSPVSAPSPAMVSPAPPLACWEPGPHGSCSLLAISSSYCHFFSFFHRGPSISAPCLPFSVPWCLPPPRSLCHLSSYFFLLLLLGMQEAEGGVLVRALSVPSTVPGPRGRAMASPWACLPAPSCPSNVFPSFSLSSCVCLSAGCAL